MLVYILDTIDYSTYQSYGLYQDRGPSMKRMRRGDGRERSMIWWQGMMKRNNNVVATVSQVAVIEDSDLERERDVVRRVVRRRWRRPVSMTKVGFHGC
jgi:hypothetical protein